LSGDFWSARSASSQLLEPEAGGGSGDNTDRGDEDPFTEEGSIVGTAAYKAPHSC
jgi:hypothetical protein